MNSGGKHDDTYRLKRNVMPRTYLLVSAELSLQPHQVVKDQGLDPDLDRHDRLLALAEDLDPDESQAGVEAMIEVAEEKIDIPVGMTMTIAEAVLLKTEAVEGREASLLILTAQRETRSFQTIL